MVTDCVIGHHGKSIRVYHGRQARSSDRAKQADSKHTDGRLTGKTYRNSIGAVNGADTYCVGARKIKVTSLLSIDVAGAFDTVSHQRLLHNFLKSRIPEWITHWARSFLTDGRTTLAIIRRVRSPILLQYQQEFHEDHLFSLYYTSMPTCCEFANVLESQQVVWILQHTSIWYKHRRKR